jgi:uncharacterized membrane protein YqhA
MPMKGSGRKIEVIFEKTLWNFRFIILVAVLALLFSSLIAFYLGAHSVMKAYHEVAGAGENLPSNVIIVYLISSIDEFLLGIILIIIALGIYELFISKIDVLDDKEIPYPSWLTFRSLEDLKGVLTKVIIIILMVYFFKSVVVLKFDTPLSILYLAAGIILIALANYISHKAPHEKHR